MRFSRTSRDTGPCDWDMSPELSELARRAWRWLLTVAWWDWFPDAPAGINGAWVLRFEGFDSLAK